MRNAMDFGVNLHSHTTQIVSNLPIFSDNFGDGPANRSSHLISDMKFTTNGNELWLSCRDFYLIVIDANDWHVIKSVAPEGFAISQFQMLAMDRISSILKRKTMTNVSIGQTDSTHRLVFLTESPRDDTIVVESLTPWKCSSIKRFTCALDGKILAVLQTDGTIHLHSMEHLIRQAFQMKFAPPITPIDQICSQNTEHLRVLDKNVSYNFNDSMLFLLILNFRFFFRMCSVEPCLVASTLVIHSA